MEKGTLEISGRTLHAGDYAYIPPGNLANVTAKEASRAAVIAKPYQSLEGVATPGIIFGHHMGHATRRTSDGLRCLSSGCSGKEVAMDRAHARTKRLLHVQRGCERSRLEDDLVAAAYELAVPILRRSRPEPRRRAPNLSPNPQPPLSAGGFSA